ncbi:hypothetical protein DFH27DRAFT_551951, partial [Peziza echinospora]
MSRAQLTPLCGSCRGFILNKLPHRIASRSLNVAATASRAPSVHYRRNEECVRLASAPSCRTFFTSAPNSATVRYGQQKGKNPKVKKIKEEEALPNLSAIEASKAIIPLERALEQDDAQKAWEAYKELADQRFVKNSLVRSLLRRGMTSQLFTLVSSNQNVLASVRPLGVAQSMVSNDIATPQMFSQLIVNCFKSGDLWELGLIIQSACQISVPFMTELAYLRGQAYTEPIEDSTRAIELPQVELWVLIYCAYNLTQDQSQPISDDTSAKPSFRTQLHHALAHMRTLPNETKIRDVLASYGLPPQFADQVVNAATSLESTTYFANLRALQEEIKMLTSKRDLTALKALYEEGKTTASPPFKEHQYNMFILAFASVNHFESATRVWNDLLAAGIEPGIHSWNALLMGCGKARDLKLLMTLWNKMVDAGITPDTFLWTTKVHALFSAGFMQEGLESLRTMFSAKNSKPNLNTINAAIDGLLRNHHLVEARKMLDFAVSKLGIQPDVVTYNTLLKGYMGKGDIKESFKVLEAMESESVQPDVVTCTIILNGLYKHALRTSANAAAAPQQPTNTPLPSTIAEEGLSTSDSSSSSSPESPTTTTPGGTIKVAELLPNTTQPTTETTLFTICSNLLTQMRSSGIEANAHFYTVLIDGLLHSSTQNLSAALDVMRIMQSRGIAPTAPTYTVFVRYYLSVGDIAAVEATWREMEHNAIPPDHIILEETVKGYARLRADGVRVHREDVVDGMLTWLRKVRELNRKSGNPNAHNTTKTGEEVEAGQQEGQQEEDDNLPARPQHDIVFRLSMRTYKEVLGRLMAEELYEFVDDVLEEVARRVASDGGGVARKANMKQLEGVLKVLGARGVVVPKELREEQV